MKTRFYILFTLVTFSTFVNGQITFNEDAKVTSLMNHYLDQSNLESSLDGWRIKLISTTDRRKFERTKSRFEVEFPNGAYLTDYENPYYSIKIGSFVDRYDLEPYLLQFKESFPEAIPFRDKIEKTELLND